MLTVTNILPRGSFEKSVAEDSIALDYDERHRRRFTYVAKGGTRFLLDLARPRVLADGEGLELSDGRIVLVEAAPERLMEARADTVHQLLRLTWHIGNRHLPAQIDENAIRLRYDHVIRAMLIGLGATVDDISAPFTPEQGAYAGEGGGGLGHGHGHGGHGHHGHDDHDHGDDRHEHGHSHSKAHGHGHEGHSHADKHAHGHSHGHSHDHSHDHKHSEGPHAG